MDFSTMVDRALRVRGQYEVYERRSYGREWSLPELALGLVGDVGDRAKLVQAHEGVRKIDDAAAALEHELADVLWSVIVLAHRCGVDLESSFARTMDELERALGAGPG
jgi:NTP pyrophosphatase (non-canonical NTP hydrolase)